MSIEADVGAVVGALRAEDGEHPSARQLSAYRLGELPEAEAERLRDHLALCRECAGLVLDADVEALEASAEFEEWQHRKPAAWASLQARLEPQHDSPATTDPPSVVQFPPSVSAGRRPWLPWAAAASLLVAFGLGSWWASSRHSRELALAEARIHQLESGTADLWVPQLGVPIHDLFPPSFHRDGDAVPVIELGDEARFFVLQLNLVSTESHADYRLRILDEQGTELWTGEGLRPTPGGTFRVVMPSRFLEAGLYTLELYGSEEVAQPLESYELRIRRH